MHGFSLNLIDINLNHCKIHTQSFSHIYGVSWFVGQTFVHQILATKFCIPQIFAATFCVPQNFAAKFCVSQYFAAKFWVNQYFAAKFWVNQIFAAKIWGMQIFAVKIWGTQNFAAKNWGTKVWPRPLQRLSRLTVHRPLILPLARHEIIQMDKLISSIEWKHTSPYK